MTDLELPEPQIFVPSPVPTSDVYFCTMDSAQDLQAEWEQEDKEKVDRVEEDRVEVEVVQGEPPSSPSPPSTPPSSTSPQSSSPTTSPYLESQQDLALKLDSLPANQR